MTIQGFLSAKILLAALLIVRSEVIGDQNTRTMRVQITTHIITLCQHTATHFIERRCRNQVTLAINLPGDWGVWGTDIVVDSATSSGTGVNSHIFTLITIDDHTTEQVFVVVRFVVDDGEYLRLDADVGCDGLSTTWRTNNADEIILRQMAEHTIL